jgi:hypothetical protein
MVGRKSGLLRTTQLQFEGIYGIYVVPSALGTKADRFRNIQETSYVEMQIKDRKSSASAEATTDPTRIADYFRGATTSPAADVRPADARGRTSVSILA